MPTADSAALLDIRDERFASVMGAGRGLSAADRLDCASPSERARGEARALLQELKDGKLARALSTLGEHPELVARRPLLRSLRKELIASLAQAQLLNWQVPRTETGVLFGLGGFRRMRVVRDFDGLLHLWPSDDQRALWSNPEAQIGSRCFHMGAFQHPFGAPAGGVYLWERETYVMPSGAWHDAKSYGCQRCPACERGARKAAPQARNDAGFERALKRTLSAVIGDALDSALARERTALAPGQVIELAQAGYRYSLVCELLRRACAAPEPTTRFLLGPYHYAQILHASARQGLSELLSERELRELLDRHLPCGEGPELARELQELNAAAIAHVGDWAGLTWDPNPGRWRPRTPR